MEVKLLWKISVLQPQKNGDINIYNFHSEEDSKILSKVKGLKVEKYNDTYKPSFSESSFKFALFSGKMKLSDLRKFTRTRQPDFRLVRISDKTSFPFYESNNQSGSSGLDNGDIVFSNGFTSKDVVSFRVLNYLLALKEFCGFYTEKFIYI